ncbi:MAG: DoxX family protein [Rhodospirillales bacterium]|nr:DoxX family protein [Rhodospirillales bacterium]
MNRSNAQNAASALTAPGGNPVDSVLERLGRIPHSMIALIARIGIAAVFFESARTKVSGMTVTDNTFFLFKEEYKVPLLPPELAAYMAAYAEHLFPLMLVLGLGARLGAAGLLAMTLVIQIFVYPSAWETHTVWAASLIYIIARGPGALSLDHLIRNRARG